MSNTSDDEANAVDRAINAVGGVAATTRAIGAGKTTVLRWRRLGRVPGAIECFKLADASGGDPRKIAAAPPPPDQDDP